MHRLHVAELARREQLDVAISRDNRIGREHVHTGRIGQRLLRIEARTRPSTQIEQEEAEPVRHERADVLRRDAAASRPGQHDANEPGRRDGQKAHARRPPEARCSKMGAGPALFLRDRDEALARRSRQRVQIVAQDLRHVLSTGRNRTCQPGLVQVQKPAAQLMARAAAPSTPPTAPYKPQGIPNVVTTSSKPMALHADTSRLLCGWSFQTPDIAAAHLEVAAGASREAARGCLCRGVGWCLAPGFVAPQEAACYRACCCRRLRASPSELVEYVGDLLRVPGVDGDEFFVRFRVVVAGVGQLVMFVSHADPGIVLPAVGVGEDINVDTLVSPQM